MKRSIRTLVFVFGGCTTLLLSNCQKKVTDLKPTPPVDSAIVNAMYPVTQSKNEIAAAYTYKYEYDRDNNLVKYSRTDDVVTYNIGTNQVDINVNEYASSNHQLIHMSTTSFVYTLAGDPNTAVNFFNTAPTQVKYTYFDKDVPSGVTSSRPGGLIQFENTKDGLPLKMISADGGGYNYNYNYDDKKNLVKAEFVHLSGPRVGAVYERISFTSFDDKPSPFSAVKGYWEASYPQGYTWEYALAFCKNNPKQIITELYDVTKSAFVKNQQDDLTYVYNDKGYPTQITINTTYFNATVTHYLTTYNYTYK
jgi:hypothetical protein